MMHHDRQRKRYRGGGGPARPLLAATVGAAAPWSAQAADGLDLTLPQAAAGAQPDPAPAATIDERGLSAYFADWAARVARAHDTQPHWSSPLMTTTGLLVQRVRFDVDVQHAGNGTDTTLLDGGKGLALIVADNTEVQFAAAPYDLRTGVPAATPKGKPIAPITGFGDWTFLRVEQRLASSSESGGNYVLTAWLQVQAPTGIESLSHAWTWIPTIAFGKGWGAFDIQGTVAAVLPASYTEKLGQQLQANLALQYHVLDILWTQLEVSWTYYPDGQRGGLSQVYLTPGLVIARLSLTDTLKMTIGAGYQSAVTPNYRAKPLTPAYDHAWVFSTRLNF